jgi:aminoglycoside 2'-N-acetyltransferase I
VRVVISAMADTPEPLQQQAQLIREQAWPPAPGEPDLGPDPALDPLSALLLDEQGEVAATLTILRKHIQHAGRSWYAAGLSAVATRKDRRGQGHGHELVVAAREAMAEMDLDLGIFTCDRPLRAFYERAGWRELPGAVLIGGTPENPLPSDQPGFEKVTMAAFFSEAARAHRKAFQNSRIALYPGNIDRLW